MPMKFLRPGDMDEQPNAKRTLLILLAILLGTIAAMLLLGAILR